MRISNSNLYYRDVFLGHHAAGLALSRMEPKLSLGWWVGAALWPDLLWAVFLYTGCEQVRVEPGATAVTPLDFARYPWSHSLLMMAVWATLAAGAGWLVARRKRAAVGLAVAVFSHWALDALSHRPDLPLWPRGPLVGLGLWNYRAATVALEAGLFLAAAALYLRRTRATGAVGGWAAWAYLGFVALIAVGSWFGPPPPDRGAIVATGLAAWLFPVWAGWFDERRQPLAQTNSSSTGA
ncbi:MAG: hypothetical protein GC160_10275 [Acidobacteria bacterium]|nr:hypothetical protein [Acidobacteriota bacterium]